MHHLRITAALLSLLSLAPLGAQSTSDKLADWSYFALGTGIGLSGLEVVKLGSSTEIVAGGGGASFGKNAYWYILGYNATTQNYDQLWVSPPPQTNASITSLTTGSLLGASSQEIAVGRDDGSIEVWMQSQRQLLTTIQTAANGLEALIILDHDQDGSNELVACNKTSTFVYDLQGKLLKTYQGAGGTSLAAGQMDADKGLELATTNGSIIDLASGQIQWTWNKGFGFDLEAADIDGDGMDELVAAEQWSWIWSYDIDTQLPKWSIASSNTGAIGLADIDADGTVELLIGAAQWGEVQAWDTKTQQKEWGIRNPEHGTTNVAWGDTDGDGQVEVLWGAGHTSTGQDLLLVGDIATAKIEWESVHLDGPFLGPFLGDLDGDGKPELVTASTRSQSGYRGGRIVVLDPATKGQLDVSTPKISGSIYALQLVNYDQDPAMEIAVIEYDSLNIYDWSRGGGFVLAWTAKVGSFSSGPRAFLIDDFDGDNKADLALGTTFLEFWDMGTKTQVHKSFYLGQVQELMLMDSDGDGAAELHARSGTDGYIYVFDAKTRQAEQIIQAPAANNKWASMGRYVVSPGGTGAELLLTGDSQGRMFFYLPDSQGKRAFYGPFPLAGQALDSIHARSSLPLLVLGSDERLSIRLGIQEVWRTARYGAGFGKHWAVYQDQGKYSLFGAGAYGVSMFRLN